MITTYFNDLRQKGIEVKQEDTIWLDIFCNYVLENKIISNRSLDSALNRTLEILEPGQSTKDAIELLRKFEIDYTQIDEKYLKELNEYIELFDNWHKGERECTNN